ncbi:hypothetical protein LCGC14_1415570 [marine sediment metagenome]|uniref:Uncharacterized protein n=1 Tax=marine sediment metagenome TaxID=412755 RepID=A0A0F9JTB7_9ZZZZ
MTIYTNVHDLTQVRRALQQAATELNTLSKTLIGLIAKVNTIEALLDSGGKRQVFASLDGVQGWRDMGRLNGPWTVGQSTVGGGDWVG